MKLYAIPFFLFLISTVNIYLVFGGETLTKIGEKKLSFKTPELNEEESKSRFLPEGFKCDACKAVTHQFYTKFEEFNKKNTQYKYKLPEYELLDLVENICHFETYQGYGIKEVLDVKRLNGPGLKAADMPGIIAGGGMWPQRIANMCSAFVEDAGEEKIYEVYRKHRTDKSMLEDYLCYDTGIRAECKKSKKKKVPTATLR